MLNLPVLMLAVFSVSLNALAQIALRKTMLAVGMSPDAAGGLVPYGLSVVFNLWFIAGMACYVVSIGVWMAVLGKLEVSLAYPLLSIGYIIATAIGYFYLGEGVTLQRVAGIGLICLGILVLSRGA